MRDLELRDFGRGKKMGVRKNQVIQKMKSETETALI